MKNTQTYELTPIFDSRKSFYGKAKIIEHGNEKRLYSYGTHVATVKGKKMKVFGTYSATTLRHIKDFLYQYGFKVGTKKEIVEWYGAEK